MNWRFVILRSRQLVLAGFSFALLVQGVLADTGTGSVNLTTPGTAVTENFDTLSNVAGSTTNTALPTGWYITEQGGGGRDNEQYAVDTGASPAGDIYSYGAAASTDRALGALRSGTLIPFFGAKFTNNTGATITSLIVTYTGEEWRLGTAGRADRIDFQISTNATDLTTGTYTDVDALDFSTPDTVTIGAKNGNAAADRTAISDTISSLSIPNGATFFIRWTDLDATGADDGLSVDDFSLTPQSGSVTLTPIHTIQGSGSTSPLVATSVTTTGIVTGTKSNGFFIQEPDSSIDADPNTSEGVFVFTSSAPPAAAATGNSVKVSGTVQEFIPPSDPNSPPMTELITPSVVLLSTGNPLPAPILISAAETTQGSETSNPLDTLEEYEGMRVTVASLTVTGATQGAITEPSATVTSSGVFIGVVSGVARPFRTQGIAISDPLPPGAPVTIPRFDENPERIRVDSAAQPGTTAIDVTAGTVITNLTGPLDYAFRCYTIDPDAAAPPAVGAQPGSMPVPAATANELTVASFNMERFFDTSDDPGTSDPVLTAAAFNRRLAKASLIVRTVQRYPDVIGVEEMENLTTLQAVAAKINNDAVSVDGLPNPNYTAYLSEGNDIGGIDVGFLVKQLRVSVVDVTQFGLTATFTNPDSSTSILNDRPPLVLRATCPRPLGGTLPFTVIVNHLRSLNGIDDTTPGSNGYATEGARVRFKRRAQAEYLANLIQARQVSDPTELIITIGDMNAFNVNDGYVDSIGTIKGTPAAASQVTLASSDLVNPDLTDLIDTLPAAQQYSYNFDGNAQTLDHIIVNPPALAILSQFAYARDDSDFAVKNYESTNELRISDHDQPVAYFSLAAPTPTPTPAPTATPTPSVSISGTITYCANPVPGPVAGVTLTLSGNGVSGSVLSDASGNYTLSSLPPGGTYAVTPAKSALAPGATGINTVDVIAVQRQFLNLGTPLSGCRLTAADVNGVSGINTVDVIAIQRFFLGFGTGIANVGKYQFSPANRTYPGLISDQTAQNYDTLIFGDVASGFVHRAGMGR